MVLCGRDAGLTQVEGVNVPSSLKKGPGVAPCAASCVQHTPFLLESFLTQQGLDKAVGFFFASVSVEPVVRLRVEPRPEPLGVRFPHILLQFLGHRATKVRHKIRSLTSILSNGTTAHLHHCEPI